MITTYLSLKKQYPSAIVLVKSGHFFETLDSDAETISPVLQKTLTRTSDGSHNLCGFPSHEYGTSVAALNLAGFDVVSHAPDTDSTLYFASEPSEA